MASLDVESLVSEAARAAAVLAELREVLSSSAAEEMTEINIARTYVGLNSLASQAEHLLRQVRDEPTT